MVWKIPDPSSRFGQTSQLPFDMFGVYRAKPIYIEVKYMNKMKSFDLGRIEDHQIANLVLLKVLCPKAECWIVLGVRVDRGDSRFYIFSDMLDIQQRRNMKKNYLKKELETLPFFSVHKNLIDVSSAVSTK
jgi:penicillin-binding protein-related factor A (putative recombinase)